MEQDKYKRIQLAYQKIVDSEASFAKLAIKTILEEVKQKGGKIVLKEPFKYGEFSSYHTLYSNGNLSGYYKNPREYCGDTIPCTVPIEDLSTLQLKKITELI